MTFILKVVLLFMISIVNPYHDPVATIIGLVFGFLLGISFIKKLGKIDEEKRFIFLRAKIFIAIVCFMLIIIGVCYVTVMYDD